jgi:hypothetical protein
VAITRLFKEAAFAGGMSKKKSWGRLQPAADFNPPVELQSNLVPASKIRVKTAISAASYDRGSLHD